MKKCFVFIISVVLFYACSNTNNNNHNKKVDSVPAVSDNTEKNNTNNIEEKSSDKIYKGIEMDKSKYPTDLYVIMPSKVTSSGYLVGKNEAYKDEFMIDHDPFTWWTPNPHRNGEGAWIELDFEAESNIVGFEVWGGSHNPDYPKYGDIHKLNNRVRKGICEFSDGSSIQFELADVDNWQVVRFDDVVKTKSIRLKINEVYKGEKWDDLCIAEFLALTNDQDKAFYGDGMAKPVIYLYPEKSTEVNVQLAITKMNGTLEYTYPEYKENGWTVIAQPDGKLIDKNTNKPYNYLFWEGKSLKQWQFNEGFVVKGTETIAFLEEKLSFMGLNPNEYNDFIVYWLPLMAKNKFNIVRFANEEYNRDIPLRITPKPESIMRIYMVFQSIDEPIDIKPQQLTKYQRKGFTVVEWGGTEIKNGKKIVL